MGRVERCLTRALLVAGIAIGATQARPVSAETTGETTVLASTDGDYATGGVEECLECHDETEKVPVLPILATPHAVLGDSRAPLARQHNCQTCHGPSAAHVEDENLPVSVVFGREAPAEPQNEKCLGCHQGGLRMGWAGSKHDSQNVPCAACHSVHVREDPVLSKNIDPMRFSRNGQANVCFQCHLEKRAQMQNRVSGHPLREGKVNCSDCHNPHGSVGPTNLARPTLNETCYRCHAEKRGPFLWEHAPVRENCANCHEPHGSNNLFMLRRREPQLCQQCHVAGQHPSSVYGGSVFARPSPDPDPAVASQWRSARQVGGNSCADCHSEIHGSNHPSGVRWVR